MRRLRILGLRIRGYTIDTLPDRVGRNVLDLKIRIGYGVDREFLVVDQRLEG
jgi:hypothetical protein